MSEFSGISIFISGEGVCSGVSFVSGFCSSTFLKVVL